MGIINFYRRNDPSDLLHVDSLFDSNDQDDELVGFLPGDTIAIVLDIDDENVEALLGMDHPGIILRRKIHEKAKGETARYEVVIEFVMKQRVHNVYRDWMSGASGFRSSATTLHVTALTDQAEDLFVKLQATWAAERYKGVM